MAAVAARCQGDPEAHILYVGDTADSIAADIGEVDGWTDTTTVAQSGDDLVGWLLGEVDHEMGRVWWWGPFLSDDQDPAGWVEVADQLYRQCRALIPSEVSEEEACPDDRSRSVRAWCGRHGLEPETASVLLRRDQRQAVTDDRIRPLAEPDHEAVKALHDDAFPGTHTTPDALVVSDHPRLVIEVDGAVGGYVAYEMQSDGSGYIDYLAVDQALRGHGLGGALVDHACREMFDTGATFIHLTVREDNPSARALYARVGFDEERLARPFRRGFKLG